MKKTINLTLVCLFLLVTAVNYKAQDDPEFERLRKTVDIISKVNALPIDFEQSSAEMTYTGLLNLQQQALLLKQLPAGVVFEVGVHNFAVGDEAINIKLTEARGEKIRKVLLGLGINAASLVVKGYGSSKPVASNANETERLKNKRVQYLVVKSGAAPANQPVKSIESVIAAGKGWGKVVIGASRSEVEAALGAPEEFGAGGTAETKTGRYYKQGVVVVYDSASLRVTEIRFIGDAKLYGATSVTFQSFQGKPDKNLAWDASVAQVVNVYGAPANRESFTDSRTNLEVVHLIYPGARFIFKGDKLLQINVMGGGTQSAVVNPAGSTESRPSPTVQANPLLGKQLYEATEKNQTETALRLIKQGAKLDYDENADTTLTLSIRNRNSELTRALLEAGANPDFAESTYNVTPLHMAAQMSNFELVKLLIDKYKVNINHRSKSGRTPLIVAAEFNSGIEIVHFLLLRGADPNAVNNDNQSALSIAVKDDKTDMIAILKSVSSAKVKAATESGASIPTVTPPTRSSTSDTRSDLAREAEAEFEVLMRDLKEANDQYADAIKKLQAAYEADRRNGTTANTFYKGTRARAQRQLDYVHQRIKDYLQKYGRVLSADVKKTLREWNESVPTYVPI